MRNKVAKHVFILIWAMLLLGTSCQTVVNGLTGTIKLTIQFSGDPNQLYYSIQEIRHDHDFETKKLEEKRLIQDEETNSLFKMKMLDSVKVPGSITIAVNQKSLLNIKVSTENLTSDIILSVNSETENLKVSKISKNNFLGYQIVRIF